MNRIYDDLYQFSQYRVEINLSTHQYLLLAEKPMLVHAGTHAAAQADLPGIEKLLEGRELAYVFISHMGADECGGLSVILSRYPNAEVICSEHTARQITGFGICSGCRITAPGATLDAGDAFFRFIEYPSDAHLLPGLLLYEEKRGIFFSSDLMMRAGDGAGVVTNSVWKEEVHATNVRQVPNRIMVHQLRKDLSRIDPNFIAVGHGYCMKL